jgi:ubiquinone/menaquinone biosynthesis C-methylase UbiE
MKRVATMRSAAGTPDSRDGPDRRAALESYRKLAAGYDASCWAVEPGRLEAIALLGLQPGQTVLDVASGTGKSFPALARAVGPAGRVIGIEQSPDMARIGQRRIDELGLANVRQIVAPVEEASIDATIDALLFHYTHDVLRTPAALARVFAAARPGARVVLVGYKLPTDWRALFNPWFRHRARGYLSTFEGIHAPWSHLLRDVPDLQIVAERFLGSGYVATGTVGPVTPLASSAFP